MDLCCFVILILTFLHELPKQIDWHQIFPSHNTNASCLSKLNFSYKYKILLISQKYQIHHHLLFLEGFLFLISFSSFLLYTLSEKIQNLLLPHLRLLTVLHQYLTLFGFRLSNYLHTYFFF